jgi:transcriptional regulator with XRE-family HTH domain
MMPAAEEDQHATLARRIRAEREKRGWTLAEFAMRSGVSRAMISKVELGCSSPTAMLLGKLSGALGVTISDLLSTVAAPRRLVRQREQGEWRDPKTGYVRRSISPDGAGPLQLVLVELPRGARVPYPAAVYRFIREQIYVLDGKLTFLEGDIVHELGRGDCLELGNPVDCVFENNSGKACRYMVATVVTRPIAAA